MRIYENCQEAVKDIGRELQKCASEVHTQTMQNKQIKNDKEYNTKELQAFTFAIINPNDRDEMPDVTLDWCRAEFLERVGEAVNPGFAWKLREDVWREFLVKYNNGVYFEYTYSERLSYQIDAIVAELTKNPETRQAIMQIHDRRIDQARMGKKRVPCSMFYHFMFRNRKLDMIYNMRSSDFITHFQNDIWLAMEMQSYIAEHVKNVGKKRIGKFIMQVSSLHVYKKDWEAMQRY